MKKWWGSGYNDGAFHGLIYEAKTQYFWKALKHNEGIGGYYEYLRKLIRQLRIFRSVINTSKVKVFSYNIKLRRFWYG